MQKIQIFHEPLRLKDEINASVGRLTRFKQQYGTHKTAVQGDMLSANDAAV
jgi:hypothetical protein